MVNILDAEESGFCWPILRVIKEGTTKMRGTDPFSTPNAVEINGRISEASIFGFPLQEICMLFQLRRGAFGFRT